MFCRNCGKPIFEGDSFCTFCGARATDAADGRTVNRPPIENPGPAPKKSGSKAWIFIVIGVLAAAAVGIGIFFFDLIRCGGGIQKNLHALFWQNSFKSCMAFKRVHGLDPRV